MMIEELKSDAEARMSKSLDAWRTPLIKSVPVERTLAC